MQHESPDYQGIANTLGLVCVRENGCTMANIVPRDPKMLQHVQMALAQVLSVCRSRSRPGSVQPPTLDYIVFAQHDLDKFAAQFTSLFGQDMTTADYAQAFAVVAGVHGALGECVYQPGTGYCRLSLASRSANYFHSALCMAIATIFPAHHAVDVVLALFGAFGVGRMSDLHQHCSQIEGTLDAADLDDELRRCLKKHFCNWLFFVAGEALCQRLLWCPGQSIDFAIAGWADLLAAGDNGVAAFYAAVLTVIEPGKIIL